MIYQIYVDESSDQKQEIALSAGAFWGRFGGWRGLTKRWNRRLRRDGLRYFRATEYCSLRGEFYRYRDRVKYPVPKGSEAARALRADLEQIIRTSGVIGIALVIPMNLYRKVKSSCEAANKIFTDDPFEMAIQSLIDQCVRDSIKHLNGASLQFFCDNGPNAARVLATYQAYKRLNPNASKIVKSLVHQDDRRFAPLQAADLMAHLGREVYSRKSDPKGIAGSVEWVKVWTEEYMFELLEHEKMRRGL